MGLTLIALIEIVATMYVYGHAKFTKDVQQMTGYTLGPYWQIMWRFVSIFMLAGLLIISTVQQFGVIKKFVKLCLHPIYFQKLARNEHFLAFLMEL